jgi:Arc/MetJ-type ribon-helix-helix transcriptional regulator
MRQAKKGATLKKQETVLTAFRLPKTLKEQVDKASDGNVSEFVRKAIEEKLDREKEQ